MTAAADSLQRFAVIGHPVAHSRSPFLHRRFAEANGIALEYTAIDAQPGEFVSAVTAFRATGGRGLNVTTPFKLDAFSFAHERSAAATAAGAANALRFEGERVLADNFDGQGLVRDLSVNLGIALRGCRLLVLGAGGAARGALLPLLAECPAELHLYNRHLARAQSLVTDAGLTGRVQILTAEIKTGAAWDVVINATSASLHGEAPVMPEPVLRGAKLAYDMNYGRGLTPFLAAARAAGVARLADGIGMLAEQAAESFRWWHGLRPDTRAVLRELATPLA